MPRLPHRGIAVVGALTALVTLGLGTEPRAEDIRACARRKTRVIRLLPAGKSCKPSETALTWSQTGPVGPAGPAGDAGAPGSALAFAHVASNGMLIAADSQNVTATSTAVGPGSAGATCVTVNAPLVRNAVVRATTSARRASSAGCPPPGSAAASAASRGAASWCRRTATTTTPARSTRATI
jgi:hypothetical protein